MSDFDEKARDWDKNKMHHDRTVAVASTLRTAISLRPGMNAMEFGAGTGLLSFELKDLFSSITLVDTSGEMLKMAKEKFAGAASPVLRLVQTDLQTESYNGDLFDIIYSQMALHHVGDVRALFTRFAEMLKPGGFLAIADLYAEDGSFHDGLTGIHFGFDPGELQLMLYEEGFSETAVAACYSMTKMMAGGTSREYPIFLLTARKE